MRRLTWFRGAVLIGVLAVAAMATTWIADAIQRRNAVETFEATLAAARTGETLDMRLAFPLPWDRVVIVGPYEPGGSSEQILRV
jgi:hypothetical protein